jgi:CcmD family protein
VKNLWYLFAAYTIIWTALFAYVVHLSRRNNELREEIRDLRAQVQKMLTR